MKIYFDINESKNGALEIADRLARKLAQYDVELFSPSRLKGSASFSFTPCDAINEIDLLITFGGDGTLLQRAAGAAEANIPILGINVGTVGFLTAAETDRLDEIAKALTRRDYKIEERAMLDVTDSANRYLALNEVALTRALGKKMPIFEVFADGCLVDNYRADGFIVATATGSTAYSLSAGGPILSPRVKGNVLTPICSHSLRNRPIVVGNDEIITIKIIGEPVDMVVDGKNVSYNNGPIQVFTAQKTVKLIHLKGTSFYAKLFAKLNLWSGN